MRNEVACDNAAARRSAAPEAPLREVLAGYWGYEDFLPLQREAMASVLAGRDSLVVLPTGGGKSLCFQAPALLMDGTAVVVSPLISLMKDQVDALAANGVPAGCLHSAQAPEEHHEVVARARRGELKLLYAAPERLVMPSFLEFLAAARVAFFAIDEAHCISHWGHDFRPEYRALRLLKERFPRAGVHAYTATATPRVRDDIVSELALRDPSVLVGTFDRPNLLYRVRPRERGAARFAQLEEALARHRGRSGIVYCITRKEVESVCAALAKRGFRVRPYHAGLDDDVRHRNQDAFSNDEIDIIVATVAFGMGIDKPDVRFVIHTGLPKSLECYQQESGRAGRDGLEAECTVFYGGGDYATWLLILGDGDGESARTQRRKLADMYAYATGVACRHRLLSEYFGQTLAGDDCGACDACLGEIVLMEDALVTGQKILCCVVRLQERFGAQYTAAVLTGAREAKIAANGHDRLSTHGLLKEHEEKQVRLWIDQLVSQGCLEKDEEWGTLKVTPLGWRVIRGQAAPRLIAPPAAAAPKAKRAAAALRSWDGVDRELFESLRALRLSLAKARDIPPYMVFGDATLRELARLKPETPEDFLAIHGIGERKNAEYGAIFRAHLTAWRAERRPAENPPA